MKALNVQINDELFALLRKTAFDLDVPARALVEGLLDDGLRTRDAAALAVVAGGKLLSQGRPPIEPPTKGREKDDSLPTKAELDAMGFHLLKHPDSKITISEWRKLHPPKASKAKDEGPRYKTVKGKRVKLEPWE